MSTLFSQKLREIIKICPSIHRLKIEFEIQSTLFSHRMLLLAPLTEAQCIITAFLRMKL